ncbi:hypothetical protein BCR44DRAFT_171984 [Catenaria anguillulae PL171]|uniref:WLM domain-containing protein n=1 Tax=Catenaria anguillulae PL171 TaxID=765915 RepID=A0A1Y2HRZ4_9FUNG|nr:hypothetical protein BCR44DRAFT_171984 [Catenaria anguillulae PL171]
MMQKCGGRQVCLAWTGRPRQASIHKTNGQDLGKEASLVNVTCRVLALRHHGHAAILALLHMINHECTHINDLSNHPYLADRNRHAFANECQAAWAVHQTAIDREMALKTAEGVADERATILTDRSLNVLRVSMMAKRRSRDNVGKEEAQVGPSRRCLGSFKRFAPSNTGSESAAKRQAW